MGQRDGRKFSLSRERRGRDGLSQLQGPFALGTAPWLVPASSQVSTNLRRLGDSESDMPRPQCGEGTPHPHRGPGHRCLLLRTLRAVDQTHPHLSM